MSAQILPSIGKDPAIRDLTKSSIPNHPPQGYQPLGKGEVSPEIGQAAHQILQRSELGDQIPFSINGRMYMGRSEPHYHQPPPEGADPTQYPKPWGWHRGITVYKSMEDNTSENYQPSQATSGRLQLLQRIDSLLSQIK